MFPKPKQHQSMKTAPKQEVHPTAAAIGCPDKTRVIVATVGDEAFIQNKRSSQLERWRKFTGDIYRAPVLFVDGSPYIRVLDPQFTPGERMLASTMVSA